MTRDEFRDHARLIAFQQAFATLGEPPDSASMAQIIEAADEYADLCWPSSIAGDLAVNGGDFTSTATTFNLPNTTSVIHAPSIDAGW